MFLLPLKKIRPTSTVRPAAAAFPVEEIENHTFSGERLCVDGCEECQGTIVKVICIGELVELIDDHERVISRFGANDWSIDHYDGYTELFVHGSGVFFFDQLSA